MASKIEQIIRNEIRREQVISVARYMELALYSPEWGYYRRERSPFGRAGDFYTAEQLQPLFGDLIRQYVAKLTTPQTRHSFSILEIGSGAADMRLALADCQYSGFDWNSDPLPDEFRGLVLSNEFFDALPVHLLRKGESGWQELGVRLSDGEFALTVFPELAPVLLVYAERYGAALPQGSYLEVCLEAESWLHRIASIQAEGVLLVLDYGYLKQELLRFTAGTIMTYRRHSASSDFLANAGNRDITAHVNFSYLQDIALTAGYTVEAELPLRAWMTHLWSEEQLSSLWKQKDHRWKLQWKQLFVGMGEEFRVLELRRQSAKVKSLAEKEKAPDRETGG